jgi:hypothetical protein
MKLPIRDEYFKQIVAGEKLLEIRDAHITFVNEKTNEKITKNVIDVMLSPIIRLPPTLRNKGMFDDDIQIYFYLENIPTKEEKERK